MNGPRPPSMARRACHILLLVALAAPAQANETVKPVKGDDPCPADRAGHFVHLPFRSKARLDRFVESALLRYVCARGYDSDPADDAACFAETKAATWTFRNTRWKTASQSLELRLVASPGRGHDLHFREMIEETEEEKPKSHVRELCHELHRFLDQSAELGLPGDNLITYSLSYIQADRALAILKTLGYPVIEFEAAPGADPKKIRTIAFDGIFEQVPQPGADLVQRPVIINVIDAAETSLVVATSSVGGEGILTELSGGQALTEMTDGAPLQRLLIVFDENDRGPLYELLDHLEREIDVPARQILIEAVVIELDRDRFDDLGISFRGSKDNFDVSFGEEEQGLIQPFVFGFERPTPKTLLELVAEIRALVESDQATVLSRPSVLVLDGRQAKINVGTNIPFTSELTIDDGTVTAKESYLKTGIVLNLRPRAAFDNSEVTFQVETIISSAGPSRISPQSGLPVAPDVQSRQVQTLVRVANDTPFVIGGLINTTDQRNVVGIPWLSEIPVLGRLFRRESKVNDRKEVIVMITPHIIDDDDRTFTYTIPRDAPEEDGALSGSVRRGEGSDGGRGRPPRVEASGDEGRLPNDGWWSEEDTHPRERTPSVFDSFDAHLFRNFYRLRSYDLFDFGFITESAAHKLRVEEARQLARELTNHRFSALPAVDPDEVEREVRSLLTRRAVEAFRQRMAGSDPQFVERVAGALREGRTELDDATEYLGADEAAIASAQELLTSRLDDATIETFLKLVRGDVPGEEVLVRHMLIRLIERLGLDWPVRGEQLIYLKRSDARLDPVRLVEAMMPDCSDSNTWPTVCTGLDISFRQCLEKKDAAVLLRFSVPDGSASAEKPCPGDSADNASAGFNPPAITAECIMLKADYEARLRDLNKEDARGLLLNRSYVGRDRRSPLQMLQSVSSLERLLELNDPETFPRTLQAFHVGRELVLPTREDLETRTHLIDCQTAQLFHDTLFYYEAFESAYRAKDPKKALNTLRGYGRAAVRQEPERP